MKGGIDPEVLKRGKEAFIDGIAQDLAFTHKDLFAYSLTQAILMQTVDGSNLRRQKRIWNWIQGIVLLAIVALVGWELYGGPNIEGIGFLAMAWVLFVDDWGKWFLHKRFQKKTGYHYKERDGNVILSKDRYLAIEKRSEQIVQNQTAWQQVQPCIEKTKEMYNNLRSGKLYQYPWLKHQNDLQKLETELLGIIRYAAFFGEHTWKTHEAEMTNLNRMCADYLKKLNGAVTLQDEPQMSQQS